MTLPHDAVPFLPRGVRLHDDRVRGMKMLLAPERALRLDATGAAILGEIDGATPFLARKRRRRTVAAPCRRMPSSVRRNAPFQFTFASARLERRSNGGSPRGQVPERSST
jgi:hypothetical protein